MPAETENLDFAVADTTLEIIFIRKKHQFIVDFTLFAFKILNFILVGVAPGVPSSDELNHEFVDCSRARCTHDFFSIYCRIGS